MTSPLKRIQNEISCTHLPYVRSIEHRENPLHVEIHFKGPNGTKHFPTLFRIVLQFPENYPYRPPVLAFADQESADNLPMSVHRLKLLKPSVWQVPFQIQDILEGIQYLLRVDL